MSWSWPARLTVPLLDAVVEGAWLAVVYAGLEVAVGGGRAYLGWPAFVAAAGVGVLIVRSFRSPVPLVVAAIAGGALGWLAHPAIRDAALAGEWSRAVPFHLAGWLLGVAVLRGAAHREPSRDDLVVNGVLRWGIALLLLPWLAASFAGVPATSERYIDGALPPTLLFVCGALLAIGIVRLEDLARQGGRTWRQGRGWWALLGSIVALFAGLSLFAALVLGRPVGAVLAAVLRPAVVALSYVVVALFIVLSPLIGLIVEIARAVLHAPPSAVPAPAPSPVPVTPGPPGAPETGGLVLVALLVVLVAAAAGFALLQRAQRRPPRRPEVPEERSFVLPTFSLPFAVPRLRWPTLRHAPTGASDAYAAALRELERVPAVARAPAESPAAHALRLRAQGVSLLPLWRLAADYQLERFGGVTLGAAETRRALDRWREVRAWVREGGGRASSAERGP